jgi:hypothetical protein
MAFSEAERRQTLDALSGLKERDTVDELGIGAIRDALSDSMFPGTSTIMTRARYLLLLNWTYRALEAKEVPSAAAQRRARDLEARTIEVLRAWNPDAGVIGGQAGTALLRMPSAIYWQALGTWSIRRFDGGQAAYFRSLDSFYRRNRERVRPESTDEAEETVYRNWDDELPVPTQFPENETLDLTRSEALYLGSRYRLRNSDTLFAWLLDNVSSPIDPAVAYPWELPTALESQGVSPIPGHLHARIQHAELFSLATYGAVLLYNLMLAEMVAGDAQENADLVQRYRGQLESWSQEMDEQAERLNSWYANLDAFWGVVADNAYGTAWAGQRVFVEKLLPIVLDPSRRGALASDLAARTLIYDREVYLKRGLARLAGGRSLDLWGGASGIGRHRFRWHRARVLVNDIVEGMARP